MEETWGDPGGGGTWGATQGVGNVGCRVRGGGGVGEARSGRALEAAPPPGWTVARPGRPRKARGLPWGCRGTGSAVSGPFSQVLPHQRRGPFHHLRHHGRHEHRELRDGGRGRRVVSTRRRGPAQERRPPHTRASPPPIPHPPSPTPVPPAPWVGRRGGGGRPRQQGRHAQDGRAWTRPSVGAETDPAPSAPRPPAPLALGAPALALPPPASPAAGRWAGALGLAGPGQATPAVRPPVGCTRQWLLWASQAPGLQGPHWALPEAAPPALLGRPVWPRRSQEPAPAPGRSTAPSRPSALEPCPHPHTPPPAAPPGQSPAGHAGPVPPGLTPSWARHCGPTRPG